ncbi:hypothetical protein TWF696_008537 [Orbilia brochopaga]|uniref:Uncharacterized protein n=1 Tax=Orbilia brochopaga TaxID=3140254 RepID=A0AAV9UJD3_9PEZI
MGLLGKRSLLSPTRSRIRRPTANPLVLSFARHESSSPTRHKPWVPWWLQYPGWPASRESVQNARHFILACAKSPSPTLLVPDPSRDGLVSGHILRQTLLALGKPKEKIGVHCVLKRGDVRESIEKSKLASTTVSGERPGAIILLAQGSHGEGEIVPGIPTLIIDHNRADSATGSVFMCTACEDPAVVKTVVLAYVVCEGLLRRMSKWSSTLDDLLAWLFLVGLTDPSDRRGAGMADVIKMKQKQLMKVEGLFQSYSGWSIRKFQKLLTIFWFTPEFDPEVSWMILSAALDALSFVESKDHHPPDMDMLTLEVMIEEYLSPRIRETERELRKWRLLVDAQPRFSEDGKLAIITIETPYEIHPFLALVWAHLLASEVELTAVICANVGYIPEKVDFSCCLGDPEISLDGAAFEVDHATHTRKRSRFLNFDYIKKVHRSKKGWPVALSEWQHGLQTSLEEYAAKDQNFASKLSEAEMNGDGSFAVTHRHMIGPGGHFIGGTLPNGLWEVFTTRCLGLERTCGWGHLGRDVVKRDGKKAIEDMLYQERMNAIGWKRPYRGWRRD